MHTNESRLFLPNDGKTHAFGIENIETKPKAVAGQQDAAIRLLMAVARLFGKLEAYRNPSQPPILPLHEWYVDASDKDVPGAG